MDQDIPEVVRTVLHEFKHAQQYELYRLPPGDQQDMRLEREAVAYEEVGVKEV